jgi:hypothetical protein
MPTPLRPAFRPEFERWAGRVRARLALRHVLTGAAIGLAVGAGASAALWQTHHGKLRPLGAVAGVLGAAAGLAFAQRRRFSDGDVALYLDARLDADETIATAIELDRKPDEGDDSARAVVISQATRALTSATPKAVRAPLWRPWHAAIPVAAAAIGWISVTRMPPAPIAHAAPGVDKVQLAKVAGIEKIIALAEMNARDDAQKKRLQKLAEEAKRLRQKLKDGVEKREAQADLAKIRDGLQAEKLSLGDGKERQGMESALGKMGEDANLKDAQKALGDRDLVSLDDEMERLANKLEKGDRLKAQKTLEEAAEAARKNGAPGVAKALEEQRKRLAEQGKKNDKLRALAKELGEALGDEGKQALGDMGKGAPGQSGKQQQKLAEALEKALGKLTPEERKKLAENLKKKLAEAPDSELGPSPSKKQLREMIEDLDTPEGQKRLAEALKKMAEEPPAGSEEGDRQKGLDGAEKGADEAGKQLGAGPPIPIETPGGPGGPGAPGGNGGKDKGNPGSGHSTSGGPGDHKGVTGVIEGKGVEARATTKINKGKPMPGVVLGRSAGKAGETANIVGSGALGQAAPAEIGGVERSDVPEEYREQVGRYFQPK